jgi:hypothetical protein
MINREAQTALEAVARKHGLAVQPQGGSCDAEGLSATLKFMFTDVTTDGQPMTPEFVALRYKYPEIAGYTFYVPGKGYVKPIGFNSRAKKYPYIYKMCSTGEVYKTSKWIIDACTPERREEA